MDIGGTIKQLRKAKFITQKELAKSTKITQSSLSQIEQGLKRVKDGNLKKICEALGVTIGGFYVMSIREDDIPEDRRELYKACRVMIEKIFL